MPVDINNNFNSAEDRIQYALGTMNAYSINIESTNVVPSGVTPAAACYPGIIALNHAWALKKFLEHCPDMIQGFSLKVNLCE